MQLIQYYSIFFHLILSPYESFPKACLTMWTLTDMKKRNGMQLPQNSIFGTIWPLVQILKVIGRENWPNVSSQESSCHYRSGLADLLPGIILSWSRIIIVSRDRTQLSLYLRNWSKFQYMIMCWSTLTKICWHVCLGNLSAGIILSRCWQLSCQRERRIIT